MSNLSRRPTTSLTLPTRHLFGILSHAIAVNEVQTRRVDTLNFYSDAIFVSGALLMVRSVARGAGGVWGWSDYATRSIQGRLAFSYRLNVEHQRTINQILAGLVRQGVAAVTLRASAENDVNRIELLSLPSEVKLLDETSISDVDNWASGSQGSLERSVTPGLHPRGLLYFPRTWLGRERMRAVGAKGLSANTGDSSFPQRLFMRITGPEESTWRQALTRVAQAWPCETVEARLCQIDFGGNSIGQDCVVFSTTGLNPAHHLALMR